MEKREEMTVEAGNKLIAEFMGAEVQPYPDGHFPGEEGYRFKQKMPMDAPDSTEGWWWNKNSLKFHSSWDWLMPVVKKILETDTGSFDVYSLYLSDSLQTANINKVWVSVVDFIDIEWYNTQLKLAK